MVQGQAPDAIRGQTRPVTTATDRPDVAAWAAQGTVRRLAGHDIFAIDAPASGDQTGEPLLIVHGFPTSSFDYAHLLGRLREHRRVVLVDLLGYGLSAKPDLHYTMALQADVVVALTTELGLDRLALLTHDMGDTVGGELLARQVEGTWPVEVTRRVVTNGSIYIDMAHLTDGQQLLLSLPDERLEAGGPDERALAASLVATLAPAASQTDMSAHAALVAHDGGAALLPRTIRYIEERRANERRFTGAIETHPSPLHVIWGPLDPIAVAPMAEQLVERRPDATLTWIDGAGHYPQIESPEEYGAAVGLALA
jgi:pimeloyl-ACP methyl ester carboxylesterase